jgi:hypothetical protein
VSTLDQLAITRNELLRRSLRPGFRAAAVAMRRTLRARVAGHRRQQARLRRTYQIDAGTPIRCWGEDVQKSVEAYATTCSTVHFAYTSGSTSRPKKIAFTPQRLALIKRASLEAAVQAGSYYGVREPSLFVLAALKEDDSLSSLILDERNGVSLYDGLVMPSKYLWEPAVESLLDEFGPTAVRLWLIVLSNPGILYATNPSTLAVFLSKLADEWKKSSRLTTAFLADPGRFGPGVRRVFRRTAAAGWQDRAAVTASDRLPAIADLFPGLRCYACWDGGYVGPFLERIRAFLPPDQYQHVPMYSMSTETLQTQTYVQDGQVHFLPYAPGVLYEFLPEGAPDDPSLLLPPHALDPGQTYCMVVSDAYGLRRYQTEDLFECVGRIRDVPDLRFRRRRGLAYSFTGEKLTGEQVSASFEALRVRFPQLAEEGVQLTCIPTLPQAAEPHYLLVLAWPGTVRSAPKGVAEAFEAALSAVNPEFPGKRSSGRLGPTLVVEIGYDALASRLEGRGSAPSRRSWETQFKLLPLYSRLWESCAAQQKPADAGIAP